jgi:hypothetical protein
MNPLDRGLKGGFSAQNIRSAGLGKRRRRQGSNDSSGAIYKMNPITIPRTLTARSSLNIANSPLWLIKARNKAGPILLKFLLIDLSLSDKQVRNNRTFTGGWFLRVGQTVRRAAGTKLVGILFVER